MSFMNLLTLCVFGCAYSIHYQDISCIYNRKQRAKELKHCQAKENITFIMPLAMRSGFTVYTDAQSSDHVYRWRKKTFGHAQTCMLMLWEYWKNKKKKLYFRLLCKRSPLSLLLTFLLNISFSPWLQTSSPLVPLCLLLEERRPPAMKAEMCHVDVGHASAVKDDSTSTRKMSLERVYMHRPD